MNEPAAIWGMQQIVFDKDISNTQNIILSQGREALKAVIRRIIDLEEFSSSGPVVNAGIDDRVHSIISDLCYQSGLASTILLNEAKKGFKESEAAHLLRTQRVAYVKKLCEAQKIKITILKDREIRNSLTHIDEKLADILTEKENIGWFIDAALNPDWETEKNLEVRYCRCFDIKNKRILHLGHELDVSALYNECLAVLAVVFGFDGKSITSRTEQCR
jgi:hypothetical protein